ncbi:hypothetical protein [Halomontanus rarus]|uniref:hypothetical protein n=1 Tax=Halomontanus rarus TaxID=3034020 RepID=UPI0023E8DC61|nr:hypothetical protein [Halovivax sp. TS33]
MSEVAFVVLFVLLGVGGPLVLYAAIQSETSNPRVVDRETAEREARERSGLEDSSRDGTNERRKQHDQRQSDRNRDRNW